MDDVDGYWVTISELARLRAVDKAAISRRVKRYEADGLMQTRPGKGGTKLVSVAQFDRAAGQATDAVRELNGTGAAVASPAVPGDPSLARQQARRAGYDADLKQLELEERLGKLLPVADVEHAMVACAQELVRVIEQMTARAEECAAGVAKDGVLGARAFLKALARDQRELLARSMTLLGAEEKVETETV